MTYKNIKEEIDPSSKSSDDYHNTKTILEMFHYRNDAEYIKRIKNVKIEIIFREG